MDRYAQRVRQTLQMNIALPPLRNPQHGVRGRRRVDCIGRMVRRPSDWEIASQSAFRNSLLPSSPPTDGFAVSASGRTGRGEANIKN